MKLIRKILTSNDCYKSGKNLIPKGITVHSTGVNNPNINRYVPIGNEYSKLHWDQPGIAKCVHAMIGFNQDKQVITCQTLPFTMKGWHGGQPTKQGMTSVNNTHIGFEICEDDLQDRNYFDRVMREAQELCAYLCKTYALDPLDKQVLLSHHEAHMQGRASNHADIDHWLKIYGRNMDWFRQCVANIIKEDDEVFSYEQFKEYQARYEEEQSKKGFSSWAIKAKIPDKLETAEFSDGNNPQSFTTREQTWAMMIKLKENIEKMFGKE